VPPSVPLFKSANRRSAAGSGGTRAIEEYLAVLDAVRGESTASRAAARDHC
jgi:hypothetical protein